jgi:hypothetical protein
MTTPPERKEDSILVPARQPEVRNRRLAQFIGHPDAVNRHENRLGIRKTDRNSPVEGAGSTKVRVVSGPSDAALLDGTGKDTSVLGRKGGNKGRRNNRSIML